MTPSRRKFGSAPCSDLLSRSNSVILRFAIAVVLHVVLEHVTWNHTVAFLSKAFWFYTTTRDTTRLAGDMPVSLGWVLRYPRRTPIRTYCFEDAIQLAI